MNQVIVSFRFSKYKILYLFIIFHTFILAGEFERIKTLNKPLIVSTSLATKVDLFEVRGVWSFSGWIDRGENSIPIFYDREKWQTTGIMQVRAGLRLSKPELSLEWAEHRRDKDYYIEFACSAGKKDYIWVAAKGHSYPLMVFFGSSNEILTKAVISHKVTPIDCSVRSEPLGFLLLTKMRSLPVFQVLGYNDRLKEDFHLESSEISAEYLTSVFGDTNGVIWLSDPGSRTQNLIMFWQSERSHRAVSIRALREEFPAFKRYPWSNIVGVSEKIVVLQPRLKTYLWQSTREPSIIILRISEKGLDRVAQILPSEIRKLLAPYLSAKEIEEFGFWNPLYTEGWLHLFLTKDWPSAEALHLKLKLTLTSNP